jgi:hypothetical protein
MRAGDHLDHPGDAACENDRLDSGEHPAAGETSLDLFFDRQVLIDSDEAVAFRAEVGLGDAKVHAVLLGLPENPGGMPPGPRSREALKPAACTPSP